MNTTEGIEARCRPGAPVIFIDSRVVFTGQTHARSSSVDVSFDYDTRLVDQ